MSKETTLVDMIKTDTALKAVISNRIHPRRMPDDATLPCVVYNRISTVPDIGLETGDRQARFRFTPWAETAAEIDDIASKLHTLFDLSRSLPDIDRILPDNDTDRYDNDALLYGRDLDFLVFGP